MIQVMNKFSMLRLAGEAGRIQSQSRKECPALTRVALLLHFKIDVR
jgi:hypothetical protein